MAMADMVTTTVAMEATVPADMEAMVATEVTVGLRRIRWRIWRLWKRIWRLRQGIRRWIWRTWRIRRIRFWLWRLWRIWFWIRIWIRFWIRWWLWWIWRLLVVGNMAVIFILF